MPDRWWKPSGRGERSPCRKPSPTGEVLRLGGWRKEVQKVQIPFSWPYRLTVRTEASQASNSGSIPGRVIAKIIYLNEKCPGRRSMLQHPGASIYCKRFRAVTFQRTTLLGPARRHLPAGLRVGWRVFTRSKKLSFSA